jgi:hypothetical protein
MTHRVALPSPRGTLFKQPREIKRKLRPLARAPRDSEHLDAIRQCPCVSCGQDPCGEAAHIRFGSLAGMGKKPPSSKTVPLCRACHDEQHRVGELTFWTALGLAPTVLADGLWQLSPTVEAMRAFCFVVPVIAGDGK